MRPALSPLFTFALLAAALAAGCCDPWEHARALAGAGAIDCGLVPVHGDRSAALDCAEAAFLDGQAFVVGWRGSGRDSPISFYRAMDAEGTAWALSQGFHGSETRVDRFRCAGDFVRADFGPPVGETFDCPVEPTAVVVCE